MYSRLHLPLLFLILCSIFTLYGDDIAAFRPAPQRPVYNESEVLESFTAAIKYKDACNQYEKEKEAWLESLTDEQRNLYYETYGYDFENRALEPAMPGEGYFWFESAANWQFTEEDALKLNETKLLIGNREWKECFEVYTKGTGPFFITSDAVLNGFHRLVEMSATKVELARYDQLESYLESIWSGLEKRKVENPNKLKTFEEGRLHGRIFIGVALSLLGVEPDGCNHYEQKRIDNTVQLINSGVAGPIPEWLGEPSEDFSAIDYSKFKPTGFYDQSPRLKAIYRAVKWLQSIPFRLDRDRDLISLGLIKSAEHWQNLPLGLEGVIGHNNFKRSFGDGNWLINFHIGRADSSNKLKNILEKTRSWIELDNDVSPFNPQNDQIRKDNEVMRMRIRMFPSYELPETTLWNYIRGKQRVFSEGFEVTVMLGSDEGSKLLEEYLPGSIEGIEEYSLRRYLEDNYYDSDHKSEEDRKRIMQDRPSGYYWERYASYSLYSKYLITLAALFENEDKQVPRFMRSSAWELKSCNTALASWAQMRHTLAAVTQENALYLGMVMVPPGFVEPNPEFFSRMASTERAFFEYFLNNGLTYDDSNLKEQMKLKNLIQLIEDSGLSKRSLSANELRLLREENQLLFYKLTEYIDEKGEEELGHLFSTNEDGNPDQPFTEPIHFQKLIETVQEDLENGNEGSRLLTTDHQIILRWMSLIDLTRHLEGLAHKQLRSIDWTSEEAEFIEKFGENLAFIMGYDGNSWLTPNDDSPRIVSVGSDPLTGVYQHIGISKTRSFYVLYPWKGRETLCHGAVLPYQTRRDNKRLTDSKWKYILEQEKPEPATWLEPILAKP